MYMGKRKVREVSVDLKQFERELGWGDSGGVASLARWPAGRSASQLASLLGGWLAFKKYVGVPFRYRVSGTLRDAAAYSPACPPA